MHRLKKFSAVQRKIEEKKLGEKRDAKTFSVCIRRNTGDTLITEFRKRSIMKKKPDFVSECIKSINVPKNGGLK